MRFILLNLLAVAALLLGVQGRVAAEKMAVDKLTMYAPNFRLLDTNGHPHELAAHKDAKAVVLFVQMNGCPIVRQSYPYMEELRAKYEPQGVVFLYVNCNPWDTNESIDQEMKEYSATVPVLRDNFRVLAHSLHFARSAETFVIKPITGDVVYRGMADDRFDYGLQRMSPSTFWLRDTLEALVTDAPVTPDRTVAKGCVLDLEYYAQPDFDKEVAPVIKSKMPTTYGIRLEFSALSEQRVRENPKPLLTALLTGRVGEKDVTFTDEEGEALAAWYFGPISSSAQTETR